jgi:hypothetical protein
MAMVFVYVFFIQIGFVNSPNIHQGADGHAVAAGIFGPKKKNKKKQQESDYRDALHAPAFSWIF